MSEEDKKTGVALLREPFDKKHIGNLPKPLKWQTEAYKKDKKTGGKCDLCGGYHHKEVIHLDYVGHAAMTDRLLDADPYWYWEPVAFTELGLPAFDPSGGLWIRLYIHDGDKVVNRLGYGHAVSSSFKDIGSREKEVIGDALRNAAMRFGAALDLWHKGDLHADDDEKQEEKTKTGWKGPLNKTALKEQIHDICNMINKLTAKDSEDHLNGIWRDWKPTLNQAESDNTELYQSAVTAAVNAKKRINAFPGDMDEFGLAPLGEEQ